MVIVDDRDFIRKALEDNGLGLYDFHDSQRVLSTKEFAQLNLTRRMDVLLIDTQSILVNPKAFDAMRPVINTFQGCYFFHDSGNSAATNWVAEQASFFPKILNICTLPMDELGWSLLANQLQLFWSLLQEHRLLQKHMVEFSQELDQVLEHAQVEMARAKKIHEVLLPKRSEEIRGVQFLSKYASGESGGAEFSDLNQVDGKIYQVFVSSESYLISSSLMGVLNDHKGKSFGPGKFLEDAEEDISLINASRKKKAGVDLLVLELDPKDLTLRAYGKSKVEFHSQLKGKIDLSAGNPYKLSKGEKFIVFSPGFLFNWSEGEQHNQDIHSFLKNHQQLSQQELMTELFFRIRQGRGEQFLKKDATVVMMEVTRHGMHQV